MDREALELFIDLMSHSSVEIGVILIIARANGASDEVINCLEHAKEVKRQSEIRRGSDGL